MITKQKTVKKGWFNIETRPVKLFGDRDRDRVANVFDCQPNNKRKQDGDDSKIGKIVRDFDRSGRTYRGEVVESSEGKVKVRFRGGRTKEFDEDSVNWESSGVAD